MHRLNLRENLMKQLCFCFMSTSNSLSSYLFYYLCYKIQAEHGHMQARIKYNKRRQSKIVSIYMLIVIEVRFSFPLFIHI